MPTVRAMIFCMLFAATHRSYALFSFALYHKFACFSTLLFICSWNRNKQIGFEGILDETGSVARIVQVLLSIFLSGGNEIQKRLFRLAGVAGSLNSSVRGSSNFSCSVSCIFESSFSESSESSKSSKSSKTKMTVP